MGSEAYKRILAYSTSVAVKISAQNKTTFKSFITKVLEYNASLNRTTYIVDDLPSKNQALSVS